MIEHLFTKMFVIYDLQDVPLTQEIVNEFFRQFNGPFDMLVEDYAALIEDLLKDTEIEYTASGVYSFVGKGIEIVYNGIPLKLPKMIMSEENG